MLEHLVIWFMLSRRTVYKNQIRVDQLQIGEVLKHGRRHHHLVAGTVNFS